MLYTEDEDEVLNLLWSEIKLPKIPNQHTVSNIASNWQYFKDVKISSKKWKNKQRYLVARNNFLLKYKKKYLHRN